MNIKKLLGLGSTALMAMILPSCVSTETVDSLIEDEKPGDEIVLSLSAPEAMNTRAENGHTLRYIAKLYKGETQSGLTFLERKEILEGENENTIVFKVDPKSYYTILMFADYIKDTTPEDGLYKDCYYYTHNDPNKDEYQRVVMLSFTDQKGSSIEQNSINNDNYDCFSGVVKLYKKETKLEQPVSLIRAVSKIRFVSTTGSAEDFSSVKITAFDFHDTFDQVLESSFSSKNFQNSYLKGGLSFEKMTDPEENELFYFYTFASKDQSELISGRDSKIEFTINYTGEEESKTISISDTPITIRKNYITTVKGKFLPEPQAEEPEDDGSGDIILHMSTSGNWGNNSNEDITID